MVDLASWPCHMIVQNGGWQVTNNSFSPHHYYDGEMVKKNNNLKIASFY